MNRPVIIIFTRVPRLGVGKRRLAREVGDRKAHNFARTTLVGLLHRLRRLRGAARVIATAPDHHAKLRAPGFSRIGQGQGDLGQRMQRAFNHYPRRPVVLIGSDIPDVKTSDLRMAFHKLRGCNAVFGPAADGGYWLTGMSANRPSSAFAKVRWSSPDALADTLRNFPRRRIGRLRMLRDVDDAESLHAYTKKISAHA
ncbi:TIGR04282 family arsenosugar biosynthesis glycosyltransferase [Acidocella sp.]|uniref:TIGR04282 family arsenosugar biosynthesis glycosyltransferase n=1 Tax=Acidocella sp. TaxID=50710 RepID=UPI0017F011D1|nr:TIGR04282 family arsenosugar biosynthesis glycosyltransferase [Acidocella sp.]NNM55734.1 glycosyltransferase [Acidocella sp.]